MTPHTIEQYRDAVNAWRKACEELDQAHAALRDVQLHRFAIERNSTGYISADALSDKAFALLKALEEELVEIEQADAE